MSYSKEQLMTALRNADAAGDVDAAKRLAGMVNSFQEVEVEESVLPDMITGNDRQTEEIQGLREVTGAPELGGLSEFSWEGFKQLGSNFTPEAFKAAGGLLTTSNPQEQMQIIKANYPNAQFKPDSKGNVVVSLDSGDYVLNAPGLSTSDVTKLIADIAAFTPAGRAASIPMAVGKNAATQAAIEGAGAATGGNFDVDEVALAGSLGGALKGAEDVIGAGYRSATGKIAPEAAEQIKNIESTLGQTARTSDVIEPTTAVGKFAQQVGEQVPVAGTGKQLERQQEARQAAMENYTGKFNASYDEIKNSITGKQKKVKEAALSSMNRATEKVNDIPTTADNTVKAIDDEILRLTKLKSGADNPVVNTGMVDTLTKYKEAIQNSGDFETLKDLRTTFRDDLSPDFGKVGNRQEGAIKRIYGAMTKDMDDVVKNNLSPQEFRQYKRGNAVYGQEINNIKKSRIKNILQAGDELSPEQIQKAILSKDSVVRNKLYQSLDSKGRENARAAIINNLQSDSVNRFLGNLDKNDAAIKTFFKGKELKELQGLRDALNATRRAQDSSVVTKSGMQSIPFIAGGAALYDLGATVTAGLAAGGLTRAYESRIVRDALLKLANTPKSSKKYPEALERTLVVLNGTMQSGTSSY